MAILSSIRKQGIFLILIIALALFAFILSDILTKGSSGPKGGDTVAVVNGTEISRQSFMEEVEATQRNMGPNSNSSQAMNMVWDRELRRVIMEEQIEKAGLTVEQAQINNALRTSLVGNPTFTNEAGQVDDAKIQEYIATVKTSSPQAYDQWLAFEQNTAKNLLQTMYLNMVKGGLPSTIADGEQEYRFQNDNVNFQFVYVPYAKIPDTDVKVSDDEIKKYVSSHSKEYAVEPQADIQYVMFSEAPSTADVEDSKMALEKLLDNKIEFNNGTKMNDSVKGFRTTTDYEEFVNANSDIPYYDNWYFKSNLPVTVADTLINLEKGAIYGPYKVDNSYNLTKVLDTKKMPDSSASKHILIRYVGTQSAPETVTRTKDDAKKLADSLLTVVRKDASKFAALATEFSDDSSKDKGGDLGTSTPGRMVKPFNDFIFENGTGTTGVVETEFGFHVISVGKQSAPKTAIKIANVTKNIESSEKTINEVFSQASKFEVAVKDGDFAKISKEKNLEVKPVNKIGVMDDNIPGVGSNRSIVSWAFNEDTNVGDTKRFSIPNGYVVAQLTRKNPKGLMDVTEASTKVLPILRNKKKAEKIRATISGKTIQEIAQSQSLTVQTATAVSMASPLVPGAGNEPKVIGAVFGKKPGELTPVVDGEKGVFVAKVTAINPATKLDNYTSFANQLRAKTVPQANNLIYQALKKNAEIEDNRASFY